MNGSQIHFRVQDDSMNADRINKGDTVVVDTGITYGKGDIILVVVDSQPIIRRIDEIGEKYKLSPSNPDFKELICEQVSIIGVVIKIHIFY